MNEIGFNYISVSLSKSLSYIVTMLVQQKAVKDPMYL